MTAVDEAGAVIAAHVGQTPPCYACSCDSTSATASISRRLDDGAGARPHPLAARFGTALSFRWGLPNARDG